MKTLALIPARAGSKGVPDKNTRALWGKHLFLMAADLGQQTCDWTYVSTNDPLARNLAIRDHQAVLVRPHELAQDDTPMLAVVEHAVRNLGMLHSFDVVVLLQPTQPLRQRKHILAALKLLEETGADSVVSVVEIPGHYNPEKALAIEYGVLQLYHAIPDVGNDIREGVERRQDCRPAYAPDGTVYAIRRKTIEAGSLYGSRCVPLIIPNSESCNIDTEDDWKRAEAMKGQANA